MQNEQAKPLSPLKWAAGVALFIAVIAGSISLGLWLGPERPATAPLPGAPTLVMTIVLVVFGAILAAIAAGLYFLLLLTNLFTFRFDQPYMKGFGRKLWLANLSVGLLAQAGFALALSPVVARILSPFVPATLLFPLSVFAPFIAAQLLLIWWTPWTALELRMIRKRMPHIGITPELMANAIPVGISDPSQSSFKRMLVEQDMGLLWIEPGGLSYRGDSQWFDLARDQVIAIERKADAGSASSYFGAVQIILRYRDVDGVEKSVRLHSEGDWTMTAKARAMNELAERLESWQASPHAVAVEPIHGFEPQIKGQPS